MLNSTATIIIATEKALEIIPWRMIASLPDLNIDHIKLKIDTGAKTSSLHAIDVKINKDKISFKTFPFQKSDRFVEIETKLAGYLSITNSGGITQKRPYINTRIEVRGESFDIVLSLCDRSKMGFRMLLGRDAVKGRFLIIVE